MWSAAAGGTSAITGLTGQPAEPSLRPTATVCRGSRRTSRARKSPLHRLVAVAGAGPPPPNPVAVQPAAPPWLSSKSSRRRWHCLSQPPRQRHGGRRIGPAFYTLHLDRPATILPATNMPACRPHGPPRPARWSPRCSPALETALRACPRSSCGRPRVCRRTGGRAADVVHRQVPKPLPAGPVLVIEPGSRCDLWKVAGELREAAAGVASVQEEAPQLAGVDLADALVEGAWHWSSRSARSAAGQDRGGRRVLCRNPSAGGARAGAGREAGQERPARPPRFPAADRQCRRLAAGGRRRGGRDRDDGRGGDLPPSTFRGRSGRPVAASETAAAGRGTGIAGRRHVGRAGPRGHLDRDGRGPAKAATYASNLWTLAKATCGWGPAWRPTNWRCRNRRTNAPLWLWLVGIAAVLLAVEWCLFHRQIIV